MTYKSKMPALLAFLAICVIGAASLTSYRAGHRDGYALGYVAARPSKPAALIELDNCAGPIGYVRVDTDGSVFYVESRTFSDAEKAALTALSVATGGTAHIAVPDGCL